MDTVVMSLLFLLLFLCLLFSLRLFLLGLLGCSRLLLFLLLSSRGRSLLLLHFWGSTSELRVALLRLLELVLELQRVCTRVSAGVASRERIRHSLSAFAKRMASVSEVGGFSE